MAEVRIRAKHTKPSSPAIRPEPKLPRRNSVVTGFAEAPSASAPFIYFEGAPTLGHLNGIIRVTLDAAGLYPDEDPSKVKVDRVLVAHLRTSLAGARELREALDKALLLAEPNMEGVE